MPSVGIGPPLRGIGPPLRGIGPRFPVGCYSEGCACSFKQNCTVCEQQAQPARTLVRDVSIDAATNPFADAPKAVPAGRGGSGDGGGEYEDALSLNVGVTSDRSPPHPPTLARPLPAGNIIPLANCIP